MSIQIDDSTKEAKLLNHKLYLVVMLVFPDAKVKWDRLALEEKRVHVGNISLEERLGNFHGLFEKADSYEKSGILRNSKVCHKEIGWEVEIEDIHGCNSEVSYNVGGVKKNR